MCLQNSSTLGMTGETPDELFYWTVSMGILAPQNTSTLDKQKNPLTS
jgi:hypothetical protein